uniref:Disease resistance N-terminal domain-containing protein n=1 Tax=Aegilops tauschii subsp. strangulata TaxID=200361 RepID=A0A453LHD4_AEGTS
MEVTVLSVGDSVVNGELSYARSAPAEQVALQLGVQRDQTFFIKDELEMMQAFLMAVDDYRERNSRAVKVWVKQVRDVAYESRGLPPGLGGQSGKAVQVVAWRGHIDGPSPCGHADEGAQG